MEEMQLGDIGKLREAGKDNMCIVDEPCVLEAGRKGLKIGLRGDLEVEPIIQRK
jgi:hypothetical protein